MEKHGYGNVYRVTDYNHPFDRYNQEPVLCLNEFRSSLQIGDVLDYLDGYPLALPARCANRKHVETICISFLRGLDDEFDMLKFLTQELQVRANSIRFQKAA